MAEYKITDRNGETRIQGPIVPDPAFNGGAITPPAGSAGLTITPVDPNSTGSETDALKIVLPQSGAPNFPNIYALVVHDPDSGEDVFTVDNSGNTTITGQPGARPLTVLAPTASPNARTFSVYDTAGDEAFRVGSDGSVITYKHLGFYGASPVARPVVPLTLPAVQDVINALVALGLVSQSD